MTEGSGARVDLYWLPLGAGGWFVRLNGRAFEALAARRERRRPLALYHTALVVDLPGGSFAVEMAAVTRGRNPAARGVVAEGPIGSPRLPGLPIFRYEVRVWRGGTIPDVAEAVDSPRLVTDDPVTAERILELVPQTPMLTWGRDELGAGDMWNSNSLVAWVIARSGADVAALGPPHGGRAPGWEAGLSLARRQGRPEWAPTPGEPTPPALVGV